MATFGALAGKLLTLRRQVSFEATLRLCGLNLLEQGRHLTPLEEFSLSKPGFFALAGSECGSKGTERSGEEEPTWQGGRRGLIIPLGGTRRGTDPKGPGISRQQRLLGTQVDERATV